MARRLAQYKSVNQSEKGDPILVDFFKENSIEVQTISVENNQNVIFDNVKSFIERVISEFRPVRHSKQPPSRCFPLSFVD